MSKDKSLTVELQEIKNNSTASPIQKQDSSIIPFDMVEDESDMIGKNSSINYDCTKCLIS